MTAGPTSTRAGITAMTAAIVLWGGGNVLVKHISIDGLTLAVDRMWFGTLVYMAAHLATGGRLSWRALWVAAPGGLCFAGDIGFFFTALRHTTVADATVIGALQPALAMMVAGPLFGERITRAELALTCAGIGGVAMAVLGSSASAGRTAFGDLLAVGALVAFTAYFVTSKQARVKLGALEYQANLLLAAAVLMTPFALLTGHPATPPHAGDWTLVALVALVPGTGHLLMNWAHHSVPIVTSSLLTLGIPVVSITGAALLGERLTLVQLVGVAVVLAAVGSVLVASGRDVAAPDEPVSTDPAVP